jgi:hypothetical protein
MSIPWLNPPNIDAGGNALVDLKQLHRTDLNQLPPRLLREALAQVDHGGQLIRTSLHDFSWRTSHLVALRS